MLSPITGRSRAIVLIQIKRPQAGAGLI